MSAGDCIVQVGMHKTGSTSIQSALHRTLDDENFYYLDLGAGGNHSEPVLTAFLDQPAEYHRNRKRGWTEAQAERERERILQHLDAELEKAGGRTAVICGEDISMMPSRPAKRLEAYLGARRRCVRVFAYIRSPVAFMESQLQQWIKGGASRLPLEELFPRYKAAFSALEEAFGTERVHYAKFDRKSLRGGCAVQDFSARFGMPVPSVVLPEHNRSLSVAATKLLFIYRRFGGEYGQGPKVIADNAALVRELWGVPGARVQLDPARVWEILQRKSDVIEWMEARLGESLDEPDVWQREAGIRDESDLLVPDDDATWWLAQRLGRDYMEMWHPGLSGETVAHWMHELRKRVRPQS